MLSAARRNLCVRTVGLVAVLAVTAAILALPACNQPQKQSQAPNFMARTGQPVLHAVYAQEIRNAMHDLNVAASQQVYMQLYVGSPVVDMRQVAEAADKMADVAANRLPRLVGPDQLAPDQLQIYNDLARRLHDEAVILKQEADRNELTASQATTNQVINTCNTCHTLFRGVAGPIS